MAARIGRVLKLVPVRLMGGEYFDTLSWIAYRSGQFSEGLRWAQRISEHDTSESAIRAYHLYFLLRGLNADPGTQDLIRECFAAQIHESVQHARVMANDDTTAGLINIRDVPPIKLPFRTRTGLIVLLIAVGFVLYPRAFFALLWAIGGLIGLSLLIALGVFLHGRFSKRGKARRKRETRRIHS